LSILTRSPSTWANEGEEIPISSYTLIKIRRMPGQVLLDWRAFQFHVILKPNVAQGPPLNHTSNGPTDSLPDSPTCIGLTRYSTMPHA
jgi:hypothetical protein